MLAVGTCRLCVLAVGTCRLCVIMKYTLHYQQEYWRLCLAEGTWWLCVLATLSLLFSLCISQKSFPSRVKGIHLYNAGTMLEFMLTLVRSTLNEKLQKRVSLVCMVDLSITTTGLNNLFMVFYDWSKQYILVQINWLKQYILDIYDWSKPCIPDAEWLEERIHS
jgi:hypothetical protein